MPVISISPPLLQQLIGKPLSDEELLQVLSELGCDVEGIDAQTGMLKLNLLPARPDLFDVCGLARAIKGYLGIQTGLPRFQFCDSNIKVRVQPRLETVRPFIAGAVVRGLKFDEELVALIMELQENLHWGLGRDRRRASIGIYDLNTVKPDFVYQPVEPEGVKFVPLGGDSAWTPQEILQNHPKGQAYAHLLKGCSVYPLLVDSQNRVLSMPPIINSEQTRVTSNTRDIFIDVTGPERFTVNKTLSVIAAVFADLGGEVQTVTIERPEPETEKTPDMNPESIVLEMEEVKNLIGIDIDGKEITEILKRMRYGAEPLSNNRVQVLVPAYRSDVMHSWDVIEDVAIGYGYHRLKPQLIPTVTPSCPLKLEEWCGLCRRALTGLGFIEIMSLNLSSPEAQFQKLGILDDGRTVVLGNPISMDQRILRRNLFSGIMETLSLNTTQPYPQRIFEIGDTFQIEESAETGALSQRRLALGIADARTGFADLRQVLEALFWEMDWKLRLIPEERMPFIPGRCAAVLSANGEVAGFGGEVHPEILERFGIGVPVVLAELEIGPLFER